MNDKGFSLIEMLIGLAVAMILFSSVLVCLNHFQQLSRDLTLFCERDEQLKLLPLLSVAWLQHTGCNLGESDQSPLEFENSALRARMDIDGPDGFPDGELVEPFEAISLRARNQSLQLKSGQGSHQPVIPHIIEFMARAVSERELKLSVKATVPGALRMDFSPDVTVEWHLYLPNRDGEFFP